RARSRTRETSRGSGPVPDGVKVSSGLLKSASVLCLWSDRRAISLSIPIGLGKGYEAIPVSYREVPGGVGWEAGDWIRHWRSLEQHGVAKILARRRAICG